MKRLLLVAATAVSVFVLPFIAKLNGQDQVISRSMSLDSGSHTSIGIVSLMLDEIQTTDFRFRSPFYPTNQVQRFSLLSGLPSDSNPVIGTNQTLAVNLPFTVAKVSEPDPGTIVSTGRGSFYSQFFVADEKGQITGLAGVKNGPDLHSKNLFVRDLERPSEKEMSPTKPDHDHDGDDHDHGDGHGDGHGDDDHGHDKGPHKPIGG